MQENSDITDTVTGKLSKTQNVSDANLPSSRRRRQYSDDRPREFLSVSCGGFESASGCVYTCSA